MHVQTAAYNLKTHKNEIKAEDIYAKYVKQLQRMT